MLRFIVEKNRTYFIFRKIFHALTAVIVFLIIWLGLRDFSPEPIDYSVTVMALIFVSLGGWLRLWALHEKGVNPRAALVRGPYALCRHPRYLGSIVFIAGACLLLFKPVFSLVLIILAAAVYHLMALKEESDCLRLYEKSYADYLATTNRWLPFYIFIHPHPTLRREIRRILFLCAAVLLIAGLRHHFYR